MKVKQLSRDHKPELDDEYERIMSMNGRIESYYDNKGGPVGPMRVWLKNQDIPGLAMSRSIGDRIAHSVGVSSVPEITEFIVSSKDKILIIASDGVWEFLTNE